MLFWFNIVGLLVNAVLIGFQIIDPVWSGVAIGFFTLSLISERH